MNVPGEESALGKQLRELVEHPGDEGGVHGKRTDAGERRRLHAHGRGEQRQENRSPSFVTAPRGSEEADNDNQSGFDQKRCRRDSADFRSPSDFDDAAADDRADHECGENACGGEYAAPVTLQKIRREVNRRSGHVRGEGLVNRQESDDVDESGREGEQQGNGALGMAMLARLCIAVPAMQMG